MRKVELLVALPGCCWLCRSSNREWYVDLDISVDFYGAVYLCDQCAMELGHIAGMLTHDETNAIIKRSENLEEDNFDLKVKVSGLEQAIDGLRLAGSGSRADSERTNVGSLPSESTGQQIAEESMGSGEGETSQSLHDEGVAELSDDDAGAPDFKLSI